MKLRILTLAILLSSINSFSQEVSNETNSLESQFDKIYRISTSYQKYKVISKDLFQRLKLNVIDSLNASKKLILERERLLKSEREKNEIIKTKLEITQQNLDASTKKENTISLFGMQIKKGTYNIILWLLIAALISGLLYFIYKFSKSSIITRTAQNNLLDTEQEFDQHRKKAIEREQKLRRQLQDLINKQRSN
ncbi:hypothetical protein BTO04_06695 [Polaribacter sp. SA4-10]|uniref:hypothetical protein n=1 Tax=Polaribacter sp. SA4-10 TaxID=754397 RepID=UPI000B3C207E|nr:hypothetical protein [Polaribacter sp. SA4-10]ARV06404.1 hypothetical protein BTO04_06695 [Polaribacter sp. SA4-10]